MAALLSHGRSRLRSISHVLVDKYPPHPPIYLEHAENYGVLCPSRPSSAVWHSSQRGPHVKGKPLHADSSFLGDNQMCPPCTTAIPEVRSVARGVHRLWHRLIQTHCECDHSWSRDKLAGRMAFLRKRRTDTRRMVERRQRFASAKDLSMPEMPLPSQPLKGTLRPKSEEEERVAALLARADLIVTRNIEWANVFIGFEQENKYVIMDPRQSLTVVGYIAESSNLLYRQFLRSRRPFEASIIDAAGTLLFKVRRPIWFINSTIYVELGGKVVGFAKRRWHLWRRYYDLYLGNTQFAVVENPGLWNWTFTLKDEKGNPLGEIDRHFRGFGYEMLTDAGQYAIRFGDVASTYHAPTKPHTLTAGYADSSQLQGIKVDPGLEGEEFMPTRPMDLLERTVTLALAISLDNDYFSRTRGGFFMFPFFTDEA